MAWSPHTLVVFGGILNTQASGSDKEIWQCGVRMTKIGGGALDDSDGYMGQIADPLAGWFGHTATTGLEALFPASSQLTYLKVNAINALGHYADATPHVHDYSPAVAGHAQSSSSAEILCLAVSWETAKAVRKGVYASHGRIYPPNYSVGDGAGNSMRVSGAVRDAWVTKGKELLALLAAGGSGSTPVIASPHGGEISPITGVRVGDVIDVQRKRKSALKESYVSATFP